MPVVVHVPVPGEDHTWSITPVRVPVPGEGHMVAHSFVFQFSVRTTWLLTPIDVRVPTLARIVPVP